MTVHPIQAYRQKEQLSAAEFARRVGVARNTVWRWENGRQRIGRRLWKRLNQETGIPLEQLADLEMVEAAE